VIGNAVHVIGEQAGIFRWIETCIHAGEDSEPRAGGSARSLLAPKFEAYFLLAAITSSTILDMKHSPRLYRRNGFAFRANRFHIDNIIHNVPVVDFKHQ
jgi:hypothetical protein